ncbi:MAG: NAD(P)-binding domain-containing protein [Planctomycetaceae bacterium]|nr:NAD(P)-binding domain-containing protein [Planctomycetaceae bacterium]
MGPLTSSSTHRVDDVTSHTGIRTVSIIGAGVMGRAIAACSVRNGHRVRIADANPQAATDAVREIQTAASWGSIKEPHFARSSFSPIVIVATTDKDLEDSDLVIEAVPERLEIKRTILSRIEPHLRQDTVIASNTSSIPISTMAGALQSPARLCGLHFCHPVSERPLVEVIAAVTTSIETQQRAFAYAASLGKSPVVVRDSPGFVLNRILSPYLTEALELLLEGTDVSLLDETALEFGMPCGPLRHLDAFGIDVSLEVGRTLLRAFPDRFVPSELLIAMYKAGRRGCKTGDGFYAANDDRLAFAVRDIIDQRSRRSHDMTADDVRRRLFLPMFLEATRVLEETVVDTPAIIDTVLRDGLGMTSEYPGLFGWADAHGAGTLLEWLHPVRPHGARFEPTSLLKTAAANGETFLRA